MSWGDQKAPDYIDWVNENKVRLKRHFILKKLEVINLSFGIKYVLRKGRFNIFN